MRFTTTGLLSFFMLMSCYQTDTKDIIIENSIRAVYLAILENACDEYGDYNDMETKHIALAEELLPIVDSSEELGSAKFDLTEFLSRSVDFQFDINSIKEPEDFEIHRLESNIVLNLSLIHI